MLKNTALLLIWLLPSLSLLAQPAQSLKAANQAYQEKEYEQAIQLYEEILQEGYHSEAVYYNLGNAYYRKEAFARAILNYQRALKLDPKDKNTLHNLGLAQARLPGQVGKIQQSGVVQAWLSVQNTFSTRLWSILGLAMLWLGGASLAISVLSGIRRRKIRTLAGGLLLLVLSLLPFLLAYGRYQQEFSTTKAVVMVEETQLRAAPEEDSKALQKLYEGVSVEILDAIGAWNKVRLEDTSEGWLPGDVLERV